MASKWWQLEHPNLVEVQYKVVELEPGVAADLDEESVKAIPALEHNPGFKAVCAKLKLQRAILQSKLDNTHHKDIREVDFLQSGLYWTKWLETFLKSEIGRQELIYAKPRSAFDIEEREFERMSASLEVVGRE